MKTITHCRATLFALGMASAVPVCAADLLAIYQDALANDPQYLAAIQRNEATGELMPQAWALLKPTVTASGNISYFERTVLDAGSDIAGSAFQDSDGTTTGALLDLNQPLFNGQAIAALGQAKRTVKQSEAGVRGAEHDLIRRVSIAYFRVQRAEDDLALARAEEKAISRQFEEANERFEVGLAAITDKVEAQARADLANASRLLADQDAIDARDELFELTGKHYDRLPGLPRATSAPPRVDDIDRWQQLARDSSPVFQQAQLAVEIAEKEVALQRAKHYPTLSANARYEYADTSDTGFGTENQTKSVSLGVEIPIYEGGAAQSRVREAKYKLQEAKLSLQQQRRSLERQINAAFRTVNTSSSRVAALMQASKSADTALEAIEAGYEVGTRTSVDVLNAQSERFRAKRDLAAARYDYIGAMSNLKYLSGVISVDDVQKLNDLLVARD